MASAANAATSAGNAVSNAASSVSIAATSARDTITSIGSANDAGIGIAIKVTPQGIGPCLSGSHRLRNLRPPSLLKLTHVHLVGSHTHRTPPPHAHTKTSQVSWSMEWHRTGRHTGDYAAGT
jgi:hypothetical protein